MNTSAYDAAQILIELLLPVIRYWEEKGVRANIGVIEISVDAITPSIQFDLDELYDGSFPQFMNDNLKEITSIVNARLPRAWYIILQNWNTTTNLPVWLGYG